MGKNPCWLAMEMEQSLFYVGWCFKQMAWSQGSLFHNIRGK